MKTTAEHLFWNGLAWQAAGTLKYGDVVFRHPRRAARVRSIVKTRRATVYNLHVEHRDHNYFANGFLVHNTKALASGGIVTRPTYAVVGEAGPEIVIPLSSRRARDVMVSMAGRPSGGGDTIIVEVAGSVVTQEKLTDAVWRGLQRRSRRVKTLGINK